MSLTDKVIKNTTYYILAQVFGFLFPLILTPLIVGFIGEIRFGIYALVLGFTGTFGLFDLSVSNSFIKFISEHYNKKEYNELNSVINTGLFFYIIFALLFSVMGLIFAQPLLSYLNIPAELYGEAVFAFRMSILIFFITTSFGIFNSILISLQKMYLTSIFGTLITIANSTAIIILLLNGYGLTGLLYSQSAATVLSILMNFIIAKKYLPEMKLSIFRMSKSALKKMTNFGAQIQVSKLASFASDKYDEFLLGFFSVMNFVTFYNLGGRIARIGRFLPYQLVPQVAPIAAELNAKGDSIKLNTLYGDTTKYLTIVSAPIFLFTFFFADTIILLWMGPGFELSSYILRILVIGQLINMCFSAPGNSITPNIGIPKYQMHEGLINLCLNVILSFILIKYYGIVGAAIGNTISVVVSSLYIYYVSSKHFGENLFSFFKDKYFKPLSAAVVSGVVLYGINFLLMRYFPAEGRASAAIYLIPSGLIFTACYIVWIFTNNYISPRDKEVFIKILMRILPLKYLVERRNRKHKSLYATAEYNNELVSIFIITYNRQDFLKKCITSLLPTLKNVNYQLVIWDNNSSDGTKEYLSTISGERIQVILNSENIGTNAKSKAAELTNGEFMIGVDDDVISFPEGWVEQMVKAYKTIPAIGFLATDVIQDEFTNGAKPGIEHYTEEAYPGDIVLQRGPAGGWCFMISRRVYERTGKFSNIKNRIFFSEDGDYINRLINKGYKYGILKNTKVYHATGEKLNEGYKKVFETKMDDYYKGGIPKSYHYRIKFQRMFNLKRMYNKIIELAEKEIANNEKNDQSSTHEDTK